jgi:hypothetical protein
MLFVLLANLPMVTCTPTIDAFAGTMPPNPKFVALRSCETPPPEEILFVVVLESSFAVTLPGLFQAAPLPDVPPVPANLRALVIGVPPTGQFAVADIVPGLPWQISIPVATGNELLVNITSSGGGEHGDAVIVHLNLALVPGGTPVTAEVGDVGLAIVAVPLSTVQKPVPGEGEFPASVKLPFSLSHFI